MLLDDRAVGVFPDDPWRVQGSVAQMFDRHQLRRRYRGQGRQDHPEAGRAHLDGDLDAQGPVPGPRVA